MIEKYTIRFGPAVSQKELERALNDPTIHGETEISKQLHKMKARIEIIADFEDLKTIAAFFKNLAVHRSDDQPRISDAETR